MGLGGHGSKQWNGIGHMRTRVIVVLNDRE
jgi:hypothetical protein